MQVFLICHIKRQEEYKKFVEDFLAKTKHSTNDNDEINANLKEIDHFPKYSTYAETRFLSLGQSLRKLLLQWECLLLFFEDQLAKKVHLN